MSFGSASKGGDNNATISTDAFTIEDGDEYWTSVMEELLPVDKEPVLDRMRNGSYNIPYMATHNDNSAEHNTSTDENNKHIPSNADTVVCDNASATLTNNASSTKISMPPPKRTFRQRRAEQLRPYTMDRLKHQSLLGGKRSSTPSGTTRPRGTVSSSQVPGFLATQDFILDSQAFRDPISSDSDDDYQGIGDPDAADDLDFGYMDDLDDAALEIVQDTQISDKTTSMISSGGGSGDDDSDEDERDDQQIRKKRRRFRILDDDEDEDEEDPTPVLNQKTKDKNTSSRSLFALPFLDSLPTLITKPSTSQLITYKRSKRKQRDKGKQRADHHEPTLTNNSHSQAGGISLSLSSSSSGHRVDNDIFDIQPLDKLDKSLQNDHNFDSSSDPINGDGELTHAKSLPSNSKPVPSTYKSTLLACKKLPLTSIRQKRHKVGNIADDDDDDGFIVDETDGHEERRRNTTLKEVRKNKRTLKGILPNSFVKVFQQQLDLEEHTLRRPTTSTSNHSSKETDGTQNEIDDDKHKGTDNDTTDATPARSMDTSVDIWDVADSYDDDIEPSSSAIRSTTTRPSTSTQNDYRTPILPRMLNRLQQQAHQREEREEQRQQRHRQSVFDSYAIDCGVPALRHGSIYAKSLNYLDDKNFSVFTLDHQPSSWNKVFGQPFSETDYFVGSPKIIAFFYQAFQQFLVMWNNAPEYADCDTNGYETRHNISAFLDFLRFVSGCLSKCYQNEDTGGPVMAEMEQFIVDEMDIFVQRILDSVGWTVATRMECRGDSNTQYSSLPLLLVLFYSVEWAFQLGRLPSDTPHWTMKVTLQRLFWYLLSLGPMSVQVTSTEPYLFNVSNCFAVEAWILALRLVKPEASEDTILWPCLQCFRETIKVPEASEISGNIDAITVLKMNEVIWQWIMTVLLLQQIQKNNDRIAFVNTHMDKDVNTQPYTLIHYLLSKVNYRQLFAESPDNIISSITQAAGTRQTDHFYTMVGIRTTVCRYHLLMMRHGWNWDMKIINIFITWHEIQVIQILTGDAHRPMIPIPQEHLETPAKYFPSDILFYNGTFIDDQIEPMDTTGTVFLKITALGLRRLVEPILEQNSETHRQLLRHKLIRMIPENLFVTGQPYSDDVRPTKPAHLEPPTVMINSYLRKPDPFISMAYYYTTNAILLHATARIGNENNPGLGIFGCNIILQSRFETVNAWSKEIKRLGFRIYDTIKKKWNLD